MLCESKEKCTFLSRKQSHIMTVFQNVSVLEVFDSLTAENNSLLVIKILKSDS